MASVVAKLLKIIKKCVGGDSDTSPRPPPRSADNSARDCDTATADTASRAAAGDPREWRAAC